MYVKIETVSGVIKTHPVGAAPSPAGSEQLSLAEAQERCRCCGGGR